MPKAALKGNRCVCEWLLSGQEGGGCLSERQMQGDRDSNTPASMARAEGHVELACWLDAWLGARMGLTASSGETHTPYHVSEYSFS